MTTLHSASDILESTSYLPAHLIIFSLHLPRIWAKDIKPVALHLDINHSIFNSMIASESYENMFRIYQYKYFLKVLMSVLFQRSHPFMFHFYTLIIQFQRDTLFAVNWPERHTWKGKCRYWRYSARRSNRRTIWEKMSTRCPASFSRISNLSRRINLPLAFTNACEGRESLD